MKCSLCNDCGWICEAHIFMPWEGQEACDCGAPGATCPLCNGKGPETPRMPEGFRTEVDKDGWRH
jgi:hypothetical protein